MKIFLDANILFSAANIDSHMRRFVGLLQERAELVTSNYALDETRRNLLKKKRAHWITTLDVLMAEISIHDAVTLPLPVELAEKDQVILGAAINARCKYLVTGDIADFGHLFEQEIQGTMPISPSLLAERLISGHL